MSKVKSIRVTGDRFPGHRDAGKVLSWIIRKIAATALGKIHRSTIEVPAAGSFLDSSTVVPVAPPTEARARQHNVQPTHGEAATPRL